MDLNESAGGIPSRISGLLLALLRHLLALTELAAEETRLLIRQSIVSILLIVAFVVSVVICYLALLATVVSLLTSSLGWGLTTAFGIVTLFHLVIVLLLIFVLRKRTTPKAYEATVSEIRRDLDALGSYSKKPSSAS